MKFGDFRGVGKVAGRGSPNLVSGRSLRPPTEPARRLSSWLAMLYKACIAASIVLAGRSVEGFAPGVSPAFGPAAQHLSRQAPARMGTTTETVDFTGGEIRRNRDVVDAQMRPRPSIDWSNLRFRLEIEFKLTEKQLDKYEV